MLDQLGSCFREVLEFLYPVEFIKLERVSKGFKKKLSYILNSSFKHSLKQRYSNYLELYQTRYLFVPIKNQLATFDLETFEIKRVQNIRIPKKPVMCKLPFDRTFFLWANSIYKCFILDSNWEVKELPEPPNPMPGSCAVYYRDCVYVFGGFETQRESQRFNLETETWEPRSRIPTNAIHCSAVVYNHQIFIGTHFQKVLVYNPQQDSFQISISLDDGSPFVCRIGNRLFFIVLFGVYEYIEDNWVCTKSYGKCLDLYWAPMEYKGWTHFYGRLKVYKFDGLNFQKVRYIEF